MLILTRYQKQSILIDQDIRITVLEINKKQVRIGIEAPDDVNIVREEILDRDELVEQE